MKTYKQLVESFTENEIEIANKTSRSNGAISSTALVPRHVANVESGKSNRTILDFGAGKDALHAKSLRDQGMNVTAHEFGDNHREGIHDAHALSREYDHVYASNVLNVQSSKPMLSHTLDQIHSATKEGGMFTGNFPMSPRKSADINADHVEGELKKRFDHVERVAGMGSKQAPVFHAKNPK